MERFTSLSSIAAPILEANIDTDVIYPARFLVVTDKAGLGQYAFYEKRFHPDGTPIGDFILNRAPFSGAQILVVGDNFGCGSSREHAPWAIRDLGIRCLISTGFGEIFYSNCFKNGVLPVTLSSPAFHRVVDAAMAGGSLTVDLVHSSILLPEGPALPFEVPGWRKEALLNGWDEIELILRRDGPAIDRFESGQREAMPWLYD